MSVITEAVDDNVLNHVEDATLDESAVSSAPVLITEQEVVLGTAAALALPRRKASGWLVDVLRRIVVAFTPEPRPRRHYPSRAGYLEHSRMAREMWRL